MSFNTRIREENTPSKRDILFTNKEEMIEDVKALTALVRYDDIGLVFLIWWSYESDRHTCHTKISMTQGLTANSS